MREPSTPPELVGEIPPARSAIRFGPYWLDKRIAVGGMSEVYLARPLDGNLPAPQLVVKRMLPAALGDQQARGTFALEARLHAAVRHPNVVEVFEAGEAEGEPFLAMEYVDGVDASRMIRRAQSEQRPIPASIAIYVVRELCKALTCVHRAADPDGRPLEIVHRDVTPSNVYMSNEGDVKLGDFGIARENTRQTSARSGYVLKGKYAYLAPEQVIGEPFDHRADLFSLAVMLTEMLIGQPLFAGGGQLAVLLAIRDCRIDPLRSKSHLLPRGLLPILERALARTPDDRFSSAEEFDKALVQFEKPPRKALREELGRWVAWAGDPTVLAKRIEGVLRESTKLVAARAVRPHADRASAEMRVVSSPPPTQPSPSPAPAARPRSTASSGPPEVIAAEIPALSLDPEDFGDLEIAPVSVSAPEPTAEPEVDIELAEEPTTARMPQDLVCDVRARDGRAITGIRFSKLIELIVTGQLDADDEVRLGSQPYARLGDVDTLARHLPPSTASTTQKLEGPGVPDYHSDLSVTSLLELLSWLLARQETGALFADCAEPGRSSRKELYFDKAKLVAVASNEPAELFGEYLVRSGLIGRADLEQALAELPRHGGHFGDTLIGLGLADPLQVFRAIRNQGRARVAEIFGWKAGRASFYRGFRPHRVTFRLDLDIPDLMLCGLESCPEARDPFLFGPNAGSMQLVPNRPPPPHALAVAWPAPVLQLMSGIGAGRTVAEALSILEMQHAVARERALLAIQIATAGGLMQKRAGA